MYVSRKLSKVLSRITRYCSTKGQIGKYDTPSLLTVLLVFSSLCVFHRSSPGEPQNLPIFPTICYPPLRSLLPTPWQVNSLNMRSLFRLFGSLLSLLHGLVHLPREILPPSECSRCRVDPSDLLRSRRSRQPHKLQWRCLVVGIAFVLWRIARKVGRDIDGAELKEWETKSRLLEGERGAKRERAGE
jgi:hypothetical protein